MSKHAVKQCSNDEFIDAIFNGTEHNILVSSFTGDPKDSTQQDWNASVWQPGMTLNPNANNYTVVSTFTDGRRKKSSFAAMHVLFLDDIILCEDHVGGSVPKSVLPKAALRPSWLNETSHGNAQLGFILDKPITELHIATRLIDAVRTRISPDKDPGMAGVTRNFKLPQGVNGKVAANGHRNKMGVWAPQRRFSLEELCAMFELNYNDIITAPAPQLTQVGDYGSDDAVARAIDWYCQEIAPLKFENDEKWELTCPWVHDHDKGAGRDDGTAIGKPGSHPELPGYWFKCHHTNTCGEHKLNDFMAWCREHGFDKTTAAEDFAEYEGEVAPPVTRLDGTHLTTALLGKVLPARDRVYGNHCFRGYVTIINGRGGVAKSSAGLVVGVGKAIGRDLLGICQDHIIHPGKVFALNSEDDASEMLRRLQAIVKHFQLTDTELQLLGENFTFKSGYGMGFRVASGQEGAITTTALGRELIAKGVDNDLVIADPLVGLHDANENDNNEMEKVIDVFRQVGKAGAGVFLVHHANKAAKAGDADNSSRGASSTIDAVRVNKFLARMTADEAEDMGVDPGERTRHIRYEDGKLNYALPNGLATWMYLHSVGLPAVDCDTGEETVEYVGVPQVVDMGDPDELKATVQQERESAAEALLSDEARLVAGIIVEQGVVEQNLVAAILGKSGHWVKMRKAWLRGREYFEVNGIGAGVKWTITNTGENWYNGL